jgi:phosphatidylserine decarboxylase
MFSPDEEFIDTGDAPSPFYFLMMFILTPLIVSRRVKRSAAFVRQKLGTGVKRTMSKSIRGISLTARRMARMKNFVKRPKYLIRKPKAPSKVSIYKMLPLKLISRVMGWITRLYLPVWLRPLIFKFYIKIFSCHAHEMLNEDLKSYRTISEFFRRKIKMELRPIDKESLLVSPCDGRVLTCGKVSRGLIEQVKGITYTASSFLGVPLTGGLMKLQQQNSARKNSSVDHDDAHSYAESLLKYRSHALYYAVIYLAPGDYHRFHSPTEWQISWRRHYIGHLFSVNPKVASWLQNLFCLNERAAYYGSWKYGFFSMTAVGATIVGSINVHFDPVSSLLNIQ